MYHISVYSYTESIKMNNPVAPRESEIVLKNGAPGAEFGAAVPLPVYVQTALIAKLYSKYIIFLTVGVLFEIVKS